MTTTIMMMMMMMIDDHNDVMIMAILWCAADDDGDVCDDNNSNDNNDGVDVDKWLLLINDYCFVWRWSWWWKWVNDDDDDGNNIDNDDTDLHDEPPDRKLPKKDVIVTQACLKMFPPWTLHYETRAKQTKTRIRNRERNQKVFIPHNGSILILSFWQVVNMQ